MLQLPAVAKDSGTHARLSLPSEAHAQQRSIVREKFLEVMLLKDIPQRALDLLHVGMLITPWKGFQMAT